MFTWILEDVKYINNHPSTSHRRQQRHNIIHKEYIGSEIGSAGYIASIDNNNQWSTIDYIGNCAVDTSYK